MKGVSLNQMSMLSKMGEPQLAIQHPKRVPVGDASCLQWLPGRRPISPECPVRFYRGRIGLGAVVDAPAGGLMQPARPMLEAKVLSLGRILTINGCLAVFMV